MPHLKTIELRTISRQIFEAAGVPAADAVVVANMLVDAELPIEGGGVMMPGQREFEMMRQRQTDGMPIDDNIWNLITELASSFGVDIS